MVTWQRMENGDPCRLFDRLLIPAPTRKRAAGRGRRRLQQHDAEATDDVLDEDPDHGFSRQA
ncbi:MAG: hypothetical protein CVU17_08940 [Betaproteobacteria bacterium HGW-Betaproteobacteria-11]|nr:MAG: hypothetical protein CVU17_08940 [Betaproteobacteria bacterium HGW-Betaproteobacteria-11]